MPPPLTVPERYRPGLAAIMALSPDAVRALVSVLEQAPVNASRANLSARVASQVSGVSADSIGDIVSTLLALYSLRSRLDRTALELAHEISSVIDAGEMPDLKMADGVRPNFEKKLTELLSVEPLAYKGKITEVLADHERIFCTARMLTDIRPIFGPSPEDTPIDARVTQMLKITYHEGSATKDIFMAMNDQTISALREVLARADTKAKSLRVMLDTMKQNHAE